MKIYYDLHIHSALSPCGDEDMTPNNIVNMACLKGLDLIAVTDHNSCRNSRAVMKAAEGKISVLHGLELTTSEEVHLLCYFSDIDAAEDMGRFVARYSSGIKNDPAIFGRQIVMNEFDEEVDEEAGLLVAATTLDIYAAAEAVWARGGLAVPAHIDRSSCSVLSNLGFLPPDLDFDGVEITERGLARYAAEYSEHMILTSSDAHYLENISEKGAFIKAPDKITKKFSENLCKIKAKKIELL